MVIKREERDRERIDAVLQILRKQAPLTLKQEKFCNDACVERFLKSKGDNVKRAAKQLRACLSWRDAIGTEHLMADEFSAELSEGVAYVAGHDDEARPVLVFRIKQDYQKFHSQKLYVRLLVFTLEVAIASMPRFVNQFVLIFDASQFRSGSAFLNLLMTTLKVLTDFYPCRLHKVFVIDPPSLFSYLWKGVRPFVDLSPSTAMVSSSDYADDATDGDDSFAAYPRAASLRFEPRQPRSAAGTPVGSSTRFAFTVSHHFDSLKPWYLSTTPSTSSASAAADSSPALVSPANARSMSFASPGARSSSAIRSLPPTPCRRTPRPSFLQSPAAYFRRERKGDEEGDAFRGYVRVYRRPYDEVGYRSRMRPPLGGLVSIVSPPTRRRHVIFPQRF
ncbi:hypothetical protein QJS10_CPB19g00810 [Acorus calamus]|uniref:CRAL-TRIO domain-containing protein n=1 Tax=Acorus calamus TaxID=4465 RepID=A0AAV9CD91_ACOCL|nr:hypothetical protein QJS10_CPB19g00810 [Acorus calamus]